MLLSQREPVTVPPVCRPCADPTTPAWRTSTARLPASAPSTTPRTSGWSRRCARKPSRSASGRPQTRWRASRPTSGARASSTGSMFETLLARLARALDAAGLPYMVIGGQAVLLYGAPRLTQDVDVTLGVDPSRLADVLGVVDSLGLTPLVEPYPFVEETLVLPCEDAATGLRVDLVFSYLGYERGAIERARPVRVGDVPVRFTTAEDLLVQKLVAGRARDLEDVRGVLVRQPDVDLGTVAGGSPSSTPRSAWRPRRRWTACTPRSGDPLAPRAACAGAGSGTGPRRRPPSAGTSTPGSGRRTRCRRGPPTARTSTGGARRRGRRPGRACRGAPSRRR